MNKMKLIAATSLCAALLLVSAPEAYAQTASSTLVDQIQSLLKQVKSLQDQLAALDAQRGQVTTQLQNALQLTRNLSVGMTSNEVTLLQQVLATDPSIYPEGLVTGYYGSMTEKAVKRLQAKLGLEQVGSVGPKTRVKLNEMLVSGTGTAGKLPPGLAKKLGTNASSTASTTAALTDGLKVTVCHKPNGNPQTLSVGAPALLAHLAHGDSLGACNGSSSNNSNSTSTATTTADTIAPVISNLAAASTASTSAYISWSTNENATSVLWYATTTPVATSTAHKVENSSLRTAHSFTLTDLRGLTTYYYLVQVADQAGNVATSTEKSVTTPAN